MINNERLQKILQKLSSIGENSDGGVDRVFGSEFMKQGQKAILEYFKECHMNSYIDSVGNVHGIYGNNNKEKEIFIGSHIDTVKCGGKFDGIMGIVAGAEVVREMYNQNYKIKNNIHIVATNGEEGNNLGGTFGSRAMMGLIPYNSNEYDAKAEKYGYSHNDLINAQIDYQKIKCFLELHIEQGPTLYNNHEQIGIVSGIVGLRRYKVSVFGHSNHAGTTMMEDRDDAVVKASKIIIMGDNLAKQIGEHFVETVGIINVFPGSAPVIPNRVDMIVEIRNENSVLMDRFIEIFKKEAEKISDISIESIVSKLPVKSSPEIVKIIKNICEEEKVKYRIMPSGATHDGNAFAIHVPIGMIFVPSINGISHDKEEDTLWKDVFKGTQILLDTVKKLEE